MRTRRAFQPTVDQPLEVREVPSGVVPTYGGSLSFLNPPASATPQHVVTYSGSASPNFALRGTPSPVTHTYPVGINTPYVTTAPPPVYGGSLSFLNPPTSATPQHVVTY